MENKKQQLKRMVKDFIEELKRENQEWRMQPKEALDILTWLIINEWTKCDNINDFVDLMDNCKDFVNLEIVNHENYKEYEEETLKRLLKHGYKYFEKMDHKKGFILHYPHIRCDGRCTIASSEKININILYNLHELEPRKKANKKRFVIIGGKWFDKINGNTYHRAKILDMKTNDIYYSDFQYGYGSQYMTSAREYLQEHINKKIDDTYLVNGGSFYMTKKEIKNKWF